MTDVGTRLQEARVGRGISLQELSARTKIREALLVAIERGDFERLPRGLLARGFIRAYAREVGLDPESLVQRFVGELEPASPVPVPLLLPPAPAVDAEQRQPRPRSQWSPLWAALLVMGVATLAAYFSYLSAARNRSLAAGAATAGSEEGRTSTDAALESLDVETHTGPDPGVAAAVDEMYPLTIEINATRVVWVQAIADGERVLYQLVQPGDRRVLDARKEIALRIGDAAALRYTVNGLRGIQVGGPGEVREIRINRDNYTAFQDR